MKNMKEAEKIYRNVLMQDPDNVDALRLLASIAMRARQWGDGVALLEKALSISPDYFQGWMDLGLGLQEQDRLDEALDAFGWLSRCEGIIPALESSHAIAFAKKYFSDGDHDGDIVVINLSGRGDKDVDAVVKGGGHHDAE